MKKIILIILGFLFVAPISVHADFYSDLGHYNIEPYVDDFGIQMVYKIDPDIVIRDLTWNPDGDIDIRKRTY